MIVSARFAWLPHAGGANHSAERFAPIEKWQRTSPKCFGAGGVVDPGVQQVRQKRSDRFHHLSKARVVDRARGFAEPIERCTVHDASPGNLLARPTRLSAELFIN